MALIATETGGVRATIAAPRERIVDVLLDFDAYPRWQTTVVECQVLERDEHGRGSLVETLIDARIRRVRYVARYEYALPGELTWARTSGDLKDISSRCTFAATGDGNATDVTVDIAFDAGFYVPRPVKALIRDQSLRLWLRELRGRVEA